MSSAIGARLGPYEIVSRLGSGGMGEVYRARDPRLGRDVAIKVSHEEFSARFEREARAIAQLNHPHICTLYDVGSNYLVMELVEGETLAARVASGALDPPLVLKYGAQIAAALAAAHAKGVIHRDLKPHNIMVTKTGVKVLDFGLAKAPFDATMTATQGIVGTPAYMAPEQRDGQEADARTDVYALGLVLFEMATGKRPSLGDATAPDGVPAQLARTIERCLARDPEERWQSARDLVAALDLVAVPSVETRAAEGTRTGRRRWLMAAAAVTVGAVAAAGGYWLRPAIPEKPFKFSILPPEGTSFLNVFLAGAPALSPDGKLIAFVVERAGVRSIWVRSLDAFDARPLPGTDGAAHPFWSPDGRSLGFFADGSLKKVDVTGGSPQVLARTGGGAAGGVGATWNGNGTILFAPGITLMAVSASGGTLSRATERDITVQDENHFQPVFLPDGRHYLVWVRGGPDLEWHLSVGELGSNQRRTLLKGVSAGRYAPPSHGAPGHLLYVRDGTLMAHGFDADRLALVGEPVAAAEQIAVTQGQGDFSVSNTGVLAYRAADPGRRELAWYDRAGKEAGAIEGRAGSSRTNLRLSPNGKFVAFTRETDGLKDVWTYDLDRDVASRLTFGGGHSPVWSPDGSHIAFVRQNTIIRKAVTGGGAEDVWWKGDGLLALTDWSSDGRYLLLTRWETAKGVNGRGLWLLDVPQGAATAREPTLLEPGALHGQFRPGTGAPAWFSFDADEGGPRQVFIRGLPGGAVGKWQVSSDGGNTSRWRRDGRELYFIGRTSLVAMEVDDGQTLRPGVPRALFATPPALRVAQGQYAPGWDITPDGQRFLTTNPTPATEPSAISVVINWQSAFLK